MIYLSPRGHPSLTPDRFGILLTPSLATSGNWNQIKRGMKWALDNGQFSGKIPLENLVLKIDAMEEYRSTCLFVVAPDVVGDAKSTIALYPKWREIIRLRGFPVAFVGQDGLENYGLPDDFDAFFIGGSTTWKLGKAARELAQEAKRRGKWLHMGRVNSLARIHYAESIGCDSVDGTHIIFEPRRASLRLIAWMNQKSLFMGGYE